MVTKLDRTLKYVHKARITCKSFNFPMDMLRYDRCMPFGPDDVFAMTRPPGIKSERDTTVTVIAYSPTKDSPFTVARWNSFGCSVQLL